MHNSEARRSKDLFKVLLFLLVTFGNLTLSMLIARSIRRMPPKRSKIQAKRDVSRVDSSTKLDQPPAVLLDLGVLHRCQVVSRPSKFIRSPYVADTMPLSAGLRTLLRSDGPNDTVLTHAPSLDCGGMVLPSSTVFCSHKESATGKTKLSIQLCEELRYEDSSRSTVVPVTVGYHPQLAETLAQQLLTSHHLPDIYPAPSPDLQTSLRSQETIGDSRVDFVVTRTQTAPIALDIAPETSKKRKRGSAATMPTTSTEIGSQQHRTAVEVKNVVCAEYKREATSAGVVDDVPPGRDRKSGLYFSLPAETDFDVVSKHDNVVALADKGHWRPQRCAIFPHGSKKPGLKVVSERAIKHLYNLVSLQKQVGWQAVVLFLVNRSDCDAFRPCHEADLLFAQSLRHAVDCGVDVVAQEVVWQREPTSEHADSHSERWRAVLGRRLPVLIPRHVQAHEIDAEHLERVLNAATGTAVVDSVAPTAKREQNGSTSARKKKRTDTNPPL